MVGIGTRVQNQRASWGQKSRVNGAQGYRVGKIENKGIVGWKSRGRESRDLG